MLKRYSDASREAHGIVRLELLQRTERANQFTVLAAWSDQQAFEAHAGSPQVKQRDQELASLLAAPNDTRQHTRLTGGGFQEPARMSITAVTHVDVVPQYKDDAVLALQQVANSGSRHRGNLRFEVWQQTNRPNHFTVVERWSTRRALEEHTGMPDTRVFRARLAAMTGALYDERLYKAVL